MKRRLILVLALALAVSTLSACTKKSGEEDTANAPEQTTVNSAANSTGEKKTVKWIQWQLEFSEGAIKLADAYMAEHPDINIELETNASNYFEVLKSMLSSNDIPEIFVTEGYNNMNAYQDYILDVSDQPFVKGISEIALDCVTGEDGKVYGLPITMSGEGIVYNKKIFKEHGYKVPTTLTELENLAKDMEAAGITPFVNQFKDDWLLGQFIAAGGYAYIPNAEDFTAKMLKGEEKLASNPQMQKNLDILDLMVKYGQKEPMNSGWNEACSDFALGKAAMVFEGDWIWDTINPIDPNLEVGMFALPATDNPADTKMIVDSNGSWHVGKGSKNEEAAIDILNWISTSETAKEILLTDFKVIPVYKDWEYKAENQLAQSTIEYINNEMTYQWPWPTWPDGFRPAAGKVYQEYIGGVKPDKKEVLEELDSLWTKISSSK